MVTTYADIKKAAAVAGEPYIDHATPDGCFGLTTSVLGIMTTYLFKGELADAEAPVLGRVEVVSINAGSLTYVGNGLKGGTFAGFRDSYEDAFAKMAA